MPKGLFDRDPSHGWLRFSLRLPILLYRLRLGWLLGGRLLLLTHTGRKSGRLRQTVLEVVEHDQDSGSYFIASGWGEKSDWYQNILAHPEVQVESGGRNISARAVRLPEEQARRILQSYAQRHATSFQVLAGRLMGLRSSDPQELIEVMAHEMPVVEVVIRKDR